MNFIDPLPDPHLAPLPTEAINWAVAKALGYRHAKHNRASYCYEVTDDPEDRHWAVMSGDVVSRGVKVSAFDVQESSCFLWLLHDQRIRLAPVSPEDPRTLWVAGLGDVKAVGANAVDALCFVIIRAKSPGFVPEDVPAWVMKPHHDRERARRKLADQRAQYGGASPSP